MRKCSRVLSNRSRHTLTLIITSALGAGIVMPSPAWSQLFSASNLTPPDPQTTDEFGVDLTSGAVAIPLSPLSPNGTFGSQLRYQDSQQEGGTRSSDGYRSTGKTISLIATAGLGGTSVVNVFGKSYFFNSTGSAYIDIFNEGASLTVSKPYLFFKDRNGTQVTFDSIYYAMPYNNAAYTYNGSPPGAVATKVSYPNGEIVNLLYVSNINVAENNGLPVAKLRSAYSNLGHIYKYNFPLISSSFYYKTAGNWSAPTLSNQALEYCSPTSDSCAYQKPWRKITYLTGDNTFAPERAVEDFDGTVQKIGLFHYLADVNGSFEFKLVSQTPSGSAVTRDTFNYSNIPFGPVRPICNPDIATVSSGTLALLSSVKRGDQTWSYTWTITGNCPNMLIKSVRTDPSGGTRTVVANYSGQQIYKNYNASHNQIIRPKILSIDEGAGKITTFTYDINMRPTRINTPEGNAETFIYDTRGNVTERRQIAKPGSGIADILEGASYPPTCSNPITCNKPISVTNPKGNVANYTYDPVHGGVLSETLTADANGIRPQKGYEYAQRYAWIKDATNTNYVRADSPIWVKTKERTCMKTAASGASCAGGATDEVVTAFEYGPDSGPNNLLLRGIAVTGVNSVGAIETQRTCYGYDDYGNKISETSPLANLSVCP
jgi:YD repeat-containing protein